MTRSQSHLLLDAIPDWNDFEQAARWIEEGKNHLLRPDFLSNPSAEYLLLAGESIHTPASPSHTAFGAYQNKQWRKFVLAAYLADLLCYPQPIDQVEFDRLAFVMSVHPNGFRIGWLQDSRGSWWPAGYTGWYPITDLTYQLFLRRASEFQDRCIPPLRHPAVEGFSVYLFNYSVISRQKKTAFSRQLMKCYFADIQEQDPSGLSAITVSPDGKRVALRSGLLLRGSFQLDGSNEEVYASDLQSK